ncbi:MAG: 4Fe-4S binding protein, partial [Rhodoplanes sp.]
LYVNVKQAIAAWLVEHGIMWPVEASAPWWILTNYANQNDVMTLLDGAVMIGYILVVAICIGGFIGVCVALSTRLLGPWSWARFHHLVQSFIPLAGCGVFLGLSMTTVTLLRHEGLDLGIVGPLRAAMLAGASFWSLWLAFRIAALHAAAVPRQVLAMVPIGLAVAASAAVWAALFWIV